MDEWGKMCDVISEKNIESQCILKTQVYYDHYQAFFGHHPTSGSQEMPGMVIHPLQYLQFQLPLFPHGLSGQRPKKNFKIE